MIAGIKRMLHNWREKITAKREGFSSGGMIPPNKLVEGVPILLEEGSYIDMSAWPKYELNALELASAKMTEDIDKTLTSILYMGTSAQKASESMNQLSRSMAGIPLLNPVEPKHITDMLLSEPLSRFHVRESLSGEEEVWASGTPNYHAEFETMFKAFKALGGTETKKPKEQLNIRRIRFNNGTS